MTTKNKINFWKILKPFLMIGSLLGFIFFIRWLGIKGTLGLAIGCTIGGYAAGHVLISHPALFLMFAEWFGVEEIHKAGRDKIVRIIKSRKQK